MESEITKLVLNIVDEIYKLQSLLIEDKEKPCEVEFKYNGIKLQADLSNAKIKCEINLGVPVFDTMLTESTDNYVNKYYCPLCSAKNNGGRLLHKAILHDITCGAVDGDGCGNKFCHDVVIRDKNESEFVYSGRFWHLINLDEHIVCPHCGKDIKRIYWQCKRYGKPEYA